MIKTPGGLAGCLWDCSRTFSVIPVVIFRDGLYPLEVADIG